MPSPGDSEPPRTHPFPFFLHHYLDWHPQSSGAQPERPGVLQGLVAASSLQQDPKPSKSRGPSAFGRREPPPALSPDPSFPPSYSSTTSVGPTYLLVHSAPLLLVSVSQPPGPHLRSSPGTGQKANLNQGLYVFCTEGGGGAEETPPLETKWSLFPPPLAGVGVPKTWPLIWERGTRKERPDRCPAFELSIPPQSFLAPIVCLDQCYPYGGQLMPL